jgi:hypothetical protein
MGESGRDSSSGYDDGTGSERYDGLDDLRFSEGVDCRLGKHRWFRFRGRSTVGLLLAIVAVLLAGTLGVSAWRSYAAGTWTASVLLLGVVGLTFFGFRDGKKQDTS